MDIAFLNQLCQQCTNWDKWGPEDELGTLNYITPQKMVAASGLVRQGKSFGLALPYDQNGPQRGVRGRFNPVRLMIATGVDPGGTYSDDVVTMPLQCGTQWDSLAHIFWNGIMWNNRPQSLVTSQGASVNSIDKMRNHLVSRGVLLDIPRYKGVEWLEEGYAVTVDDLEGAAAKQGVTVGSGDVVVVRTGHQTMCLGRRDWGTYAGGDAPGLSLLTAPWLYENEIAALCTDTWGVEVRPNEINRTMSTAGSLTALDNQISKDTEGAASPLHRALVGEVMGTFILVFIGTGCVAAAVLTDAQIGLWQVAVVWGFGVTLAIYASAGLVA